MRTAEPDDLPFLQRMLYEAANRPGDEWPPFEVSIGEDRNRRFWSGWKREGDIGVIGEEDPLPIGAAWIRRFAGSELSPTDNPEVSVLAIGVEREHRGRGVGGLLMAGLIAAARREDVGTIALTTGLFNTAALRLYRSCGFEEVMRRGEGVKMQLLLQ